MENSNWQNDWAKTTLDVIQMVSTKQGAIFYYNDTAPREDLESYLTVEAQKLADKYQPAWNVNNPERYWGGYLWKSLIIASRWHWSKWIGVNTTEPRYAVAAQANSPWARIEHLLNKDDQVMQVEHRMSAVTGDRIPSPEDHYLRIERLMERLATLEGEPLPKFTLCIEEGCMETYRGTQTRCERHYRAHLEIWGEGERCQIENCVGRAAKRGLCNTHYAAHRLQSIETGTWEPTPPAPTHCTVKDCDGVHAAHGLCNTHYGKFRQSLLPPCTEPGCTQKQLSKNLCQRHYNQLRQKNKPPCSIEGCEIPQQSRKMCQRHYKQSQKNLKPPCVEEGCTKPQYVKALCTTHYQRMKKGQP